MLALFRLGNYGLKVSKITLACMSYGNPAWQVWVLPEEEGIKHIKAAYDAGVNAFDTANASVPIYSNGHSEIILGKAIKQHNLPREEIVVMTKLFFTVGQEPGEIYATPVDSEKKNGYVNQCSLSRKHIFNSVKHSLERLQLDYIDVLQCERQGYVRYIGMSSCYAWQFHVMQNAIQHNLTSFVSMQNHHSLLCQEDDCEMFLTLKVHVTPHFGVGSIPWSPLARSMLTRPIQRRTETDPVEEIAKKRCISTAQVAVAYSMGKEGISAPIVGKTSVVNLEDLIGATEIALTEEVKYLEEPYKPLPAIF
ncbi:Aldo/keto reductase [Desarmillaria ectypa]|nr:Aldo/keto reductase [Desarmillaria ectypa]